MIMVVLFWKMIKEYDVLKQKKDLMAKFYIEVDRKYRSFIKSQYNKYGIEWVMD
jgi:hypothetical protein